MLKDGHIVRCLACEEGFTRIRLADKLSMACIPGRFGVEVDAPYSTRLDPKSQKPCVGRCEFRD